MEYAGYSKRFLAFLFDMVFVYSAIFMAYIILPNIFISKWVMTSWLFILYYFVGYMSFNGSIGDLTVGQRVIVETTKNKWLFYLMRSMMLSILFVPFTLSYLWILIAGMTAFFSICTLFIPPFRNQKKMFLEVGSKTAVINGRGLFDSIRSKNKK